MNQGYYIATKGPDGCVGLPVGNDDDAVMLFDDLDTAKKVRDSMSEQKLSIFKVGIVEMGEVIIP